MIPSFARTHGARPAARGGVDFRVWAPRARRVAVRVRGKRGFVDRVLEPREDGFLATHVAEAAPGDDYVFVIDDRGERPDPASRWQPRGVTGDSRIVDTGAWSWSDAGWRGVDIADAVFYEIHVGTFTREGTFEAVIDELPRLRRLGVTAIELMPIGEFPGARNWGYDGVFGWAPQSTYGGPAGLQRLVDAAHVEGLAVFLDVVYNHVGPEGNVLHEFAPYFTDRYRTPWGDAINFDGEGSDFVRSYFSESALQWMADYHVDGLRLDAVHAICDFSARPFLAELSDVTARLSQELGRKLSLVAESDRNDPQLVRSHDRGGTALDGMWNDDFHHAVHAALTGERNGYYADFGRVADLAKTLEQRFVYDGCYSRFRRRRHGAPAEDVPAQRFIVSVQNHDQVGNRACGERLTVLLSAPQLRLAATFLLLSPFVPLLFMGEEYGETAPFLYFVDHTDQRLRDAVRQGRRGEFRAFGWRGEVPDPSAESTFERSRLSLPSANRDRGAIHALYADLLRLRREHLVLRPGNADVRVFFDESDRTLALLLEASGEVPLFVAWNLCDADRDVGAWAPGDGAARLLLATDDARYGGATNREREETPGRRWKVPAETAMLWAIEEHP
jgi:maltooligosyltrehalose trehalohydrolase